MKIALHIALIVLLLAFVWQFVKWGWRECQVVDRDEQRRMLGRVVADASSPAGPAAEPAVRGAGADEGRIHGARLPGGGR